MAALQSPGLATGLDVNSIVSQVLAIEQRPLLRMAQRETEYQAEISALGNLKSALSKLQEAASALQNTSTFQAIQASSSNEEVLSASDDVAGKMGGAGHELRKELEALTAKFNEALTGIDQVGATFARQAASVGLGIDA